MPPPEPSLALESPALRFTLSHENGSWELLDKAAGVTWRSNPAAAAFGSLRLRQGERAVTVPIAAFEKVTRQKNVLTALFAPVVEGEAAGVRLTVRIGLLAGGRGVSVAFETREQGAWKVESARLLEEALWTTDAARGYAAIPERLGVMLPADDGREYVNRYHPFSNNRSYSMRMAGMVRDGAGILVTWDDPYTVLEVRSRAGNALPVPGRQMLSLSLEQRRSARRFEIRPVGRGGYVEIAQAYRQVARHSGLLKTWREKARQTPDSARVIGAMDFKPFVFTRTVASSVWNRSGKEETHVGFTFEEAADLAEHFHRDLQIDRALFVLAGWIHRGYDNQHPDILPAAPECGGDAGLQAAAQRIKACGYLFGLHDNYQDLYRDAPSWNEDLVMRHPDGSLFSGGNWAGGQAYLICSRKGLELAERPQNLPAVRRLFEPTAYFVDTTFAAPPFECSAPDHPLTLADDLAWKVKLCDYAKTQFGVFGSEEGQEWAVPHADYFEGLLSHRTQSPPDARIIPMFPLVYREGIPLYTHQGDRSAPERPQYVLDHIVYASMPVAGFPEHRYWRQPAPEGASGGLDLLPEVASVRPAGPHAFEITYRWNVRRAVTQPGTAFVHFTQEGAQRAESIAFQNDHAFSPPMTAWQAGQVVTDGPHRVELPEGASGVFDLRLGLLDAGGNRLRLPLVDDGSLRYLLGRLRVEGGNVTWEKAALEEADPACFARGDGGWTEGLHPADRLNKNLYEILSPLCLLTSDQPMTGHRFLSEDRLAEEATYGGKVRVLVNKSARARHVGDQDLPPYGFIIQSPTFAAFYADRWNGLEYAAPALFTLRSLDGRPLDRSGKVRVYHGFGDARIRLRGKVYAVKREAVLQP